MTRTPRTALPRGGVKRPATGFLPGSVGYRDEQSDASGGLDKSARAKKKKKASKKKDKKKERSKGLATSASVVSSVERGERAKWAKGKESIGGVAAKCAYADCPLGLHEFPATDSCQGSCGRHLHLECGYRCIRRATLRCGFLQPTSSEERKGRCQHRVGSTPFGKGRKGGNVVAVRGGFPMQGYGKEYASFLFRQNV
jgi:hypothetical protein